MSDYNEMMLNKRLYQLDADEARQEAIEEKAQEISKKIRGQHFVKINSDSHLYHVEDFMSDMETPEEMSAGDYCAILTVDADSYEEGLNDKFESWCEYLAVKDIDNEEPPECDYDTREEYEGDY